MGWGVRTLKGLIVGSSDDDKLLGRVRQGQYVIVDNLKVSSAFQDVKCTEILGSADQLIFPGCRRTYPASSKRRHSA